eukprot:904081_1
MKDGWKCPHSCIWTNPQHTKDKKMIAFNRTGKTKHCKDLKHPHTTECCYIYWTHSESFEEAVNRIKMLYVLNDEEHKQSNKAVHPLWFNQSQKVYKQNK